MWSKFVKLVGDFQSLKKKNEDLKKKLELLELKIIELWNNPFLYGHGVSKLLEGFDLNIVPYTCVRNKI